MKRHIFAAAFGALMVVLPVREALRADAALYTVEDVGGIDDLVPTITGMNANGDLSGYVIDSSGLPHAVRFTAGAWSPVPDVSTFYSVATGINDHGDVVGYHYGDTGVRAFRYMVGPGATFVEPLPGDSTTIGLAINAHGDIVGESSSDLGTRGFRALLGESNASLLPMLPGGGASSACGINAAGQIAGSSMNAAGKQHAYRIETDNSVTDIVPFDGSVGSGTSCGIDATGRVGGRTSNGALRAFVFDALAPVNVDTLANSTQSNIESVSAGVSAGWFISQLDNSTHAFVNTAGVSTDLNDLIGSGTGWQLDQAFAVNVNGSIAGIGRLNGQTKAFRLTRVATVSDKTPPTFTALSVSPSEITLPNGAMVAVTVTATASDDRDPSPVCRVTGIDGHGAPAGDSSVTGPLAGSVRATGGARYSFAVSCSDATGNAVPGSVDVVVARDSVAPSIDELSANPSEIGPPNGALVPVTVLVRAHDNVDAAPSCGLSSITSTATTADDSSITGPFSARLRAIGGRTYTLKVTCSDGAGNQSSSAVAVMVAPDRTAPVIGQVSATPETVWPPNSKMVPVSVSVSASDDLDPSPQCSLKSVVSNNGSTTDAVVTGQFTANVRSEKNADGSVRVYTLNVACRDAAGNQSWGWAAVSVTKDPPAPKLAANKNR